MNGEGHRPVLLQGVLACLAPRDGAVLVDATFGGGGISAALLAAADCRVLAIDRDPEAIARGRPLSRRDLAIDDPYNTYRHGGLPPGPIANPGRSAIDAVLHPADTDALYFVADGSGGHAFAATLDEHNRNVARWRARERRARR